MKSHSLRQIQIWVQSVTSHPAGVESGACELARHTFRGTHIQHVVAPSRQLTSVDRIAIYSDMYFARLVDCLRTDFPVLLRILGDDVFEALCRSYLKKHPSRHFSLNKLGANLPKFLKSIRRLHHRSFICEVAAVERSIDEVFDAREESHLSLDDLLPFKAHTWPTLRFKCSAALQLFSLQFPVNGVIEQMKTGGESIFPKRQRSWLAIYRYDFTVWRLEMDQWKFILIAELQKGKPLSVAVNRAVRMLKVDEDEIAASVKNWLEFAVRRGWFVGVRKTLR